MHFAFILKKIQNSAYKVHPYLWDLKYIQKDPWGFQENKKEIFRKNFTIQKLKSVFPNAKNILELGCAEGFQTIDLNENFEKITALDSSHIALVRAKKMNLKNVSFQKADINKILKKYSDQSFDVVIACEVLYYLENVSEVLYEMNRVSRLGCFVTYYHKEKLKITPHLKAFQNVSHLKIKENDKNYWTAVFWNRNS